MTVGIFTSEASIHEKFPTLKPDLIVGVQVFLGINATGSLLQAVGVPCRLCMNKYVCESRPGLLLNRQTVDPTGLETGQAQFTEPSRVCSLVETGMAWR